MNNVRQRGTPYPVKGGYGIRWRENGQEPRHCPAPPFPTKTAARDWFARNVLPRLRGEVVEQPAPSSTTFSEFVELYLEAHAANVTPRTLETLRTRLRSVSKRFGDVPLVELESMAAEIAAWRASLGGETARYAYTAAMRQACEAAVQWGRLSMNPAKAAGRNPQPTPKRNVRPFTIIEVDAIAVELGPQDGPLVVFAAETGLRPEEWIPLERRDVDRDALAVRVERTYTGGEIVPTTKTKLWRRVPLSARAVAALDRLPVRIDTPLHFPGPSGGLRDLDNWRTRDWYPALEAAGVEKCGPYRLRHTYASSQLAAGVTMFELAKVMGTSAKMIEKTYGHLMDDSEDVIRAKQDAWAAEQLAKLNAAR